MPTVCWQVLDESEPAPAPIFYPASRELVITNPHHVGERRDILFELLQPPKYTEAEVQRLLAAPAWPTAPGQVLMLENELVRMWDFRASLGMCKLDFHQHVFDNAWVVLGDDSALTVSTPSPEAPPTAHAQQGVHAHESLAIHSHVLQPSHHDARCSQVFRPDGNGKAIFEKTVHFHDGFVSWNQVTNGGFMEDDVTPLAPACVHSVENVGRGEFREYLIEIK